MNLTQALGAAAGALVMGLSAGGVAPAQTMSQIAAQAHERLPPDAIRSAAEELAAMLEQPGPQHLAARLSSGRDASHRDAHLRTMSSGGCEQGRRVLPAPQEGDAFAKAQSLLPSAANAVRT